MGRREYGFTFDGTPVFDLVDAHVTEPSTSKLDDDVFVFVMGPYTAFDGTYQFPDVEFDSPYVDDPLFDPDSHASYEETLRSVCASLRDRLGVRAFIATDIPIPTEAEADDSDPSMSVLDQSVAFAAVSDAVVFLLTTAGLVAGPAVEIGSILGEFGVRRGDAQPIRKPRERFHIFQTPDFSSASVDEIPTTYGVDVLEFTTNQQLLDQITEFLVNIERHDRDRTLPIYRPYGEE